jgi:hypothetical protein
MPTELERLVQLVCSAQRRNDSCPRSLCRRYRYCVPPRLPHDRNLFRCPFDADDVWPRRHAVAQMLAERLITVGEAGYAARGVPSPFASEPAADHLDLTRPFDASALLTAEKEAYTEIKASAARRPY